MRLALDLVDQPSSCSDVVGWVIWPVKSSLKWPILCRVRHWTLLGLLQFVVCWCTVAGKTNRSWSWPHHVRRAEKFLRESVKRLLPSVLANRRQCSVVVTTSMLLNFLFVNSIDKYISIDRCLLWNNSSFYHDLVSDISLIIVLLCLCLNASICLKTAAEIHCYQAIAV